ncbi:ArsR/SmtB family transcription factor [Microbacterium lacticum]
MHRTLPELVRVVLPCHPSDSRFPSIVLESACPRSGVKVHLELTRTNVSNHLTCLRGCGLIVATPEGRRTRYEIADPHLTQGLRQLLEAVVAVDEGAPCMDDQCECCA